MSKKSKKNKDNFFNFNESNKWDIGWPMSPRLFVVILIPITLTIAYLASK